jgi:hypothetical protein
MDLEPGRATTASTGAERCGVVQTGFMRAFCRVPRTAPPEPGQPATGFVAFLAGTVRTSRRLANSNMPSSESSRP